MIMADRFWCKVDIKGVNDCWEWQAAKFPNGYGSFRVNSTRTSVAHRIAFLLHTGNLSDDKIICHTCDNPSCVNPNHLFEGTHSDNANDMVSKGRHSSKNRNQKGELNNCAKLNAKIVLKIRSLYTQGKTQKEISLLTNVNKANVWCIVHRKSWQHI